MNKDIEKHIEAIADIEKPLPKEQCGSCVFKMQGTHCGFCANPKQEDKDLRGYVYWNYTCDLFSKGRHKETSIDNFHLSENYNGFKNESIRYE